MSEMRRIRGFVDIEYIDKDTGEVFHREPAEEFDGENLVLNLFRANLPFLLTPKIVTGRDNDSPSAAFWLDRRIALIGFGIGDGGENPTVKPEDPEDGRSKLNGESDFPNSKQGLQGPIRRIPLGPGPSEVNTPTVPINSFYLFKEVDPDGVSVAQVEGGGAEMTFVFTVEEDEYIGGILEYGLYFGGGTSSDDTQFEIEPGVYERRRLSRESAIIAARKTRRSPIEKTRDFKFRAIWRIRT